MGGTPLASPPGVDSSLGDELSKGPYAISGWSDLPSLELPQALAFAAVCRSWCSAAMVAGVPRSCRTWLLSWADFLEERESLVLSQKKKCQDKPESHAKFPAATCLFRHLLDADKAYEVNFPKGFFVACCGASHGWLVLANDLSNLVLFNPFSSAMVPLPPITDFACVEAIYGSKGNLECYLFAEDRVHAANSLGTWFYQKAVLSCSPSRGPYTSSGWSDLPSDLLLSILQRLELPQALAFAAVCTSWCSVAKAAGIPRTCTLWLMSWADVLKERESQVKCISGTTCKFRHLLDVDKAYDVDFPKGCFAACCGASHGWLVLVNDISNLVLFNPFTSSMVSLPPITDFPCVEAVYGSRGNLEYYVFEKEVHDANSLGAWFYQKAVLSCSPSKGGDYIVMIIHRDSDWLSFVRAGESKWHVVSSLAVSKQDRYADCVYHNERFYTVTLHGIVEKWDVDGPNGPTKEVIVANRHYAPIITRHLVSTPWGDLLHVRSVFANCRRRYPDNVRFQIRKVDPEGYKEVSRQDLAEHAMFLGLNHSACLPTKNFPGLRSHFIYFSAPWTMRAFHLLGQRRDWGGVRAYDLKRRMFKHAFPFGGMRSNTLSPSEVWITPNM